MAEEAATPAAPAPVTETEKKTDNKGKNRRKKEDETPIEELFDLSQPIPRVSSVFWFPIRKMTPGKIRKSDLLGAREGSRPGWNGASQRLSWHQHWSPGCRKPI